MKKIIVFFEFVKTIIGVTLLYLFIFIPKSYGQQIALSISPPLLEVMIQPGKSVLVGYKIENTGDPLILKAHVLPFEPKDTLGNVRVKNEFEGPIRFSLDNADIKLDQSFVMKTNDSQQLLVRIRVPEGAPNGDYYYTLLLTSQPPPTIEGTTSSRAQASIGSNILLTVSQSGTKETRGKVVLFNTSARYQFSLFGKTMRIFDSNDDIPVTLILENQGKNVIVPNGNISTTDMFGSKKNYTILGQNILSESQRMVLATPSASLKCKSSKNCNSYNSLVLSNFHIGKIRIETHLNFGPGTQELFANTSIIALPFKFIGGLTIIIIITSVIIHIRNKELDKI